MSRDSARRSRCCNQALKMIGRVYEVEAYSRKHALSGERKRLHRLEHAKPLVEQFFAWVAELTPRQWQQHFGEQPLRSDLHGIG